MEEWITEAAFYDPITDTIYPVGKKHLLKPLMEYHPTLDVVRRVIQPENHGYITNLGRWLSRRKAAEICHCGDCEGLMDSKEIPTADHFEIDEPPHEKVAHK